MTDPAVLEVAVRGVAVGAFLATGAALAASRQMQPVRWIGVLLMASGVAHVVESHFYYTENRHFSFVTWGLAASAAGVLWLFCSTLLEDDARNPPWRYAIPALAFAFFAVGAMLPPSPARLAVWWAFAVYSVLLHAHIMLMAWRGWKIDLVERRRHLRAPIAASAAGYMFIQTLCDFSFGRGPVLPSMVQALALAGLGVGAALVMLRAEPALVQVPPVAGEAPVTSPVLDLTPADRLVMARLDKAMTENEVWRGEDLSIGTLAALVGAPEHRLRRLINGTLGHRNFADYVNGRRIEAAKLALSDPEQALKSVSTIAYELGFASLGPFNRAFRTATGATPSAWRQQATPAIGHLRLVETGEQAPKSDKRA